MRKKKANIPIQAADGIGTESPELSCPGEWMLSPFARHAAASLIFGSAAYEGTGLSGPDLMPAVFKFAKQAENGDLSTASHLLMSQALTLDNVFTELLRQSALNMGQYPNATERFMRLAFKAQANSRATVEALAKLHQPREQTVKHIHLNHGAQAVVADQFHHHGGGKNENDEQPHEPNGAARIGPALLGPDQKRNALPMSGDERQEALPASRRGQSRRTNR